MCNQRTLVHFLKTDLGMSPREDARVPLTRLFDAAPDPGPRERAIRWRVPDGARAALPRLAEVDAAELLVPATTAAALTALATLLRPDGGDLAPAQWLACDPRALVRAALEFDVPLDAARAIAELAFHRIAAARAGKGELADQTPGQE